MTSELLSMLGIEEIALFSLILLVSFGLAGFRFSTAGIAGTGSSEAASSINKRLRRRQAVKTPSVKEEAGGRSQYGDVLKFAGSVFTEVRKEAAQVRANQSMIRFRHAALEGVKAPTVQNQAHDVGKSDSVAECRAGVTKSEPQRMDSDTQWMRVNSIVAEGLGKAKEIEALHEAASRQLDAVDYAYERMLVELKDILPAVVEARTMCRSNRDKDYAAASAGPAERPAEQVGREQAASNGAAVSTMQDRPEVSARGPAKKAAANRAEVAAA